jgi:predicted Mrr-cat superfamily restriction endonuclease
MTMWRAQSGPLGELEDAIERNAVALLWYELPDLSKITTKESLTSLYRQFGADQKPQQVTVAVGQIWAFLKPIQIGDLVVMPLKRHAAVAVGTVDSSYEYRSDLGKYIRHIRRVKWIQKNTLRSKFEQDLLYSFRGRIERTEIELDSARSSDS